MSIAYSEFEMQVRSLLKARGYEWPELMRNIWINGQYVFRFSYEHRECAAIEFGRADRPINTMFPGFDDPWLSQCLRPYSGWLTTIGIEPQTFAHCLGGWESGGLRQPDFASLLTIIEATLPKIEAVASNAPLQAQRP
jgi:hypothetical protein